MDRFTWAMVGGVVALVAAGLIAATALRTPAAPPDITTPNGLAMAYALAEQRGDAQAAWDLLAASAQARGDHDRFLARAGNKGTDHEYLSTEDERVDSDGASASVVLVHTYPGSGGIFGNASYTRRDTVRLAKEANGWRITVPPDDYLLGVPKP
jgi:hypothetical protein